jgi:hypothetical protein
MFESFKSEMKGLDMKAIDWDLIWKHYDSWLITAVRQKIDITDTDTCRGKIQELVEFQLK